MVGSARAQIASTSGHRLNRQFGYFYNDLNMHRHSHNAARQCSARVPNAAMGQSGGAEQMRSLALFVGVRAGGK